MPAETVPGAFEARLASLQARFNVRLRAEAAALAAFAKSLSGGVSEEAELLRLRDLAHGLHGAAGAFGQPRIGEAAARLEFATEAALADRAAVEQDRIAAVQLALAELRAELGPEGR